MHDTVTISRLLDDRSQWILAALPMFALTVAGIEIGWDSSRAATALWLVTLAGCIDTWTHRIPNHLIYSGMVCAALTLVVEANLAAALNAVAGAVVVGLPAFLLWKRNRSIRGGDVKLLIGLGLLLGLVPVVQIVFVSHAIAAIFVVLLATRLLARSGQLPAWKLKIPMGGFYAAGVLGVFAKDILIG